MLLQSKRLFFSVKFSSLQQQQLQLYQRQALTLCAGAKAVDSDNLHLTLFFLGQTDSGQQQRLISAAGHIKVAPFSITLDSLSCFNKPKIMYLAPSKIPNALLQLQQHVAEYCKAEGFNDIHDSYRPHITLARQAVCAEQFPQRVMPLTLDVSEFALYQSVQFEGRLHYWPLHNFLLL